jgi:hypothetical protein
MRRAADPRGLHEVLAAEQQSGGLRPAQALAAAVADERGAELQVDVRYGQDLGRRVDQHRHAALVRGLADGLRARRAFVRVRAGQDVAERCARAEGGLELVGRLDLDDLHARRAQRRVVDVAGVLRDDALVLREAAQVGQPHVQVGVAAGETRDRRVRERRGAADRDHAPLRLRQLGEALADGLRQLVQVHVVLRGRLHRGAHFGQRGRSRQDRVRAACVHERADADRLVDLGSGPQPGAGRNGRSRARGRCGLGGGASAEKRRNERQQAAPTNQLAA